MFLADSWINFSKAYFPNLQRNFGKKSRNIPLPNTLTVYE